MGWRILADCPYNTAPMKELHVQENTVFNLPHVNCSEPYFPQWWMSAAAAAAVGNKKRSQENYAKIPTRDTSQHQTPWRQRAILQDKNRVRA